MPTRAELENLRSVMCFTLMAVCVIQAWVLVFVLKIGPVVVSGQAGHGVHEGDFLAIPLAMIGLVLYGAGWVRERDGRPGPGRALA